MRVALTFHLTYFASIHYRVKRRCSILLGYTTLKVVICDKQRLTTWWKFDEVLAKTILHSFLRHGV